MITFITTLTLGLWPKQGHGKLWVESATWESHSHSWECGRVWRNEPTYSQLGSHFGSWSPENSQIFRKRFEGLKLIGLNFFYTNGKFLRHKCLNWARMIHLSTYNTSYGRKKGRESKCQFDSWPLKVRYRPELCACRWHATYFWRDLDEGYNFASNFTSIGGLHKISRRPKWWESQFREFRDSRLGSPKENDIWVQLLCPIT